MRIWISKIQFVIIFSGFFLLFGCSSLQPISYYFVENDINSASINFVQGEARVSFVSYNEYSLPESEKGTFWNSIFFPSGVPLEIIVHAYYFQSGGEGYSIGLLVGLITDVATSGIRKKRSVDNNILFLCPPLEAGKEYRLSFKKEGGVPGKNILVLTDIVTKKVVYQQEFVVD